MKFFQIFKERFSNRYFSSSTFGLIFGSLFLLIFYICFFGNIITPFLFIKINANCNVTSIQIYEENQYIGSLQVEASLYNGETLFGTKTECESSSLNYTTRCILDFPKQFECQGTKSMIRTKSEVDSLYKQSMLLLFTPWIIILLVLSITLFITISGIILYRKHRRDGSKIHIRDDYFVYFDVGLEDAHGLRDLITETPFKDEMNQTTDTDSECVLWISTNANTKPLYMTILFCFFSFLGVCVVPNASQLYLFQDRFVGYDSLIFGLFLSIIYFIYSNLFFLLISPRKKVILVTDCRLIELTFRGVGYDINYILLKDIQGYSLTDRGLVLSTPEKQEIFGEQYDYKYCEEIRDLLQQKITQ